MFCFSNPLNETAKNAVNAFAQALAARFNPVVGCTRSWDTADSTDFKVCPSSLYFLVLDVCMVSKRLSLTIWWTWKSCSSQHIWLTTRRCATSPSVMPIKRWKTRSDLMVWLPVFNSKLWSDALFRWNMARRGIQFDNWLGHSEGDSAGIQQW